MATQAVKNCIERDDAVKNEIVGPMMGTEWPTARRFPDRVVQNHTQLGDIGFRVRDLGPGESPADSLWLLDESHVFVGDLVYNGMHAYLADGCYDDWLTRLAELESSTDRDATLYVGHGEPAGVQLFATQRRYVETFVDAVRRNLSATPDERREAIVREMKRLLPSDDLSFLMELSIEPVAARLGAS